MSCPLHAGSSPDNEPKVDLVCSDNGITVGVDSYFAVTGNSVPVLPGSFDFGVLVCDSYFAPGNNIIGFNL